MFLASVAAFYVIVLTLAIALVHGGVRKSVE